MTFHAASPSRVRAFCCGFPKLTDVDDFAVAMSDPEVMRLISIINSDNEPLKRVAAKIGARHERGIVRPAGYFAELWTT